LVIALVCAAISDETGIAVAGKDKNGHSYVLADISGVTRRPSGSIAKDLNQRTLQGQPRRGCSTRFVADFLLEGRVTSEPVSERGLEALVNFPPINARAHCARAAGFPARGTKVPTPPAG
jgi:hypothetical protein